MSGKLSKEWKCFLTPEELTQLEGSAPGKPRYELLRRRAASRRKSKTLGLTKQKRPIASDKIDKIKDALRLFGMIEETIEVEAQKYSNVELKQMDLERLRRYGTLDKSKVESSSKFYLNNQDFIKYGTTDKNEIKIMKMDQKLFREQ